MELFNSKNYRDNLAKDLKEIRKTDPEKASEVLEKAQQTTTYKEALKSHQEDVKEESFTKKIFTLQEQIKELSKSGKQEDALLKVKEIEDLKENRFTLEEKKEKAKEFVLSSIKKREWKDLSVGVAKILGKSFSHIIKKEIVNSPEILNVIKDDILVNKKLDYLIAYAIDDNFKTTGIQISQEIINSPEIKELVEKHVKENQSVYHHSAEYSTYNKNQGLIDLLGLPKELNYPILCTMISGASYTTFQSGASMTYSTALAFAKSLPSEYVAEHLKSGGKRMFNYNFGGNNSHVDISGALDTIKTFQLSKEDILPKVESFIDSKIWGSWQAPYRGLELLRSIKSIGIEKGDFSQDFINSMKRNIKDSLEKGTEVELKFAEDLAELVLPDKLESNETVVEDKE